MMILKDFIRMISLLRDKYERERTSFAEFISNGEGKVKATELLRDSYFNFKIIMKSV